jgi:DtxR family transcriptional regulator, Mn-dependent transcriptional regulator
LIKLSNTADEILETLWVSLIEKEMKSITLGSIKYENRDTALIELKNIGYIDLKDGKITLLPAGYDAAQAAMRRHRLAECLMINVIKMSKKKGNKSACEFEHMLEPEMEEKICSMLGHPVKCPHGNPIPPGRCCSNPVHKGQSFIKRLSEMKAGQKGKVAYLHTGSARKLQKLMIMGVLPGVLIKLLIAKPSYVFQVGNTQVAVDKEIATDIFVSLESI